MRSASTRACIRLFVTAAALFGIMLVGLIPAHGAARPSMKVHPGKSSVASFPPLLGVAPTSGAVDLDPETCASPEVLFCDTVPVDVTASGDLSLEVGWGDLDGGTDDIDIILYDAGSGGRYSKIGAAETASRPEQIIVRTGAGRVHLVVVHYAGANNGYSIIGQLMDSTSPAPVVVVATPRQPSATLVPPNAAAPTSPPRGTTARPSPNASPVAGEPVGRADVIDSAQRAETFSPSAPAQSALAVPRERGSDLGQLAWIAAVICPLAIAGMVVGSIRRRPGADL